MLNIPEKGVRPSATTHNGDIGALADFSMDIEIAIGRGTCAISRTFSQICLLQPYTIFCRSLSVKGLFAMKEQGEAVIGYVRSNLKLTINNDGQVYPPSIILSLVH